MPYVAPPSAAIVPRNPALEVKVNMRDGVQLHTIVFFPFYAEKPPPKPVGTILYRTPYNASSLAIQDNISTEVLPYVVDPGLAIVIQDVRGCGPVAGCGQNNAHGCVYHSTSSVYLLFLHSSLTISWLPYRVYNFPNNSVSDGYDTVDWIVHQSWSNGKVGLCGPSALAIDEYELMTLMPHPAIKAAFLQIGQATEHKQWFPGGAYRQGMAEIYLGAMAQSLNSTRPAQVIAELRKNEGWGPAWDQQSGWTTGDDGLSGWDRGRKAAIPAIHVAGWYDVFGEDQLETFNQLNDSSSSVGVPATAPQWLWVVPGGHCLSSAVSYPAIGPNAVEWTPVPDEALLFSTTIFHNYVADPTAGVQRKIAKSMELTPRLSYFVVGPGIEGKFGNAWHHTSSWPRTEKQRWFLAKDGRLQLGVPGDPLAKRSLIFDPADPVGTRGGNNLFILPCGPQDQNYVDATNDSHAAFENLRNSDECANASCGAKCFSELEKLYQNMANSPRPDILRFDSRPFVTPVRALQAAVNLLKHYVFVSHHCCCVADSCPWKCHSRPYRLIELYRYRCANPPFPQCFI